MVFFSDNGVQECGFLMMVQALVVNRVLWCGVGDIQALKDEKS